MIIYKIVESETDLSELQVEMSDKIKDEIYQAFCIARNDHPIFMFEIDGENINSITLGRYSTKYNAVYVDAFIGRVSKQAMDNFLTCSLSIVSQEYGVTPIICLLRISIATKMTTTLEDFLVCVRGANPKWSDLYSNILNSKELLLFKPLVTIDVKEHKELFMGLMHSAILGYISGMCDDTEDKCKELADMYLSEFIEILNKKCKE